MNWQEAHVTREIRRQARAIVRLSSKISQSGDFPNDAPIRFAKIIETTAESLERAAESAPAQLHLHMYSFLCDIGVLLRYVERSRVAHVPWSMIQPLERFLRQFVSENTSFLIRPQWSYNYSITVIELIQICRESLEALTIVDMKDWEERSNIQADSRIYTITFPRFERNNVLLHANFGHELGHVIVNNLLQDYFEHIWFDEEEEISQHFKARAKEDLSALKLGELIEFPMIELEASKNTQEVRDIAQKGLDELLADFVGVHLFGAAALSALAEMAVRSDMDANPKKCQCYPPWRFRLRKRCPSLLTEVRNIELLDGPSLAPELKKYFEWLHKIESLTTDCQDDINNLKADPSVAEAYKLIDKHLEQLERKLCMLLPKEFQSAYSLSQHKNQIIELAQSLENHIPPNETGAYPETRAAELADILNAGWARKCNGADCGMNEHLEEFDALCLLVLKGIENSYVKSVYGPLLREEASK